MAKTTKIMDIRFGGMWFVCILDTTAKFNPYKVYQKWYEPEKGWHRKKLNEYADPRSALFFIANYR